MGTEKCCDVNIRVRVQEYIKCLKETTYFNELDSESQNTIIDQIRQDLSEYVPQVKKIVYQNTWITLFLVESLISLI